MDFAFKGAKQVGDLAVGISFFLGCAQQRGRDGVQLVFFDLCFQHHQLLDLIEEPLINFAEVLYGAERDAKLKRIVNVKKPVPTRVPQAFEDFFLIPQLPAIGAQTVSFNLQRLTRFLQSLLKVPANAHHFAHRLHLKAEVPVRPFEFIKIPTWYFYDYIIQGRFKIGRGCFGNLVI